MDELKAKVKQALQNAADNGFDFQNMTPREIAIDMITYGADLEDEDVDAVAEIVEELRK